MNEIIKKIGVMSDDGCIEKKIIEEFEKTGYYFPQGYKNLLSLHNGLYPIKSAYDFINIYGRKYETSIFFLGYGDVEFDKIEAGQEGISNTLHYGIPHLVAFGGFANEDYIGFDCRDNLKTCNPKVVHVYHDDYTENEGGTSSMTVNFVANSFKEFIDIMNGGITPCKKW